VTLDLSSVVLGVARLGVTATHRADEILVRTGFDGPGTACRTPRPDSQRTGSLQKEAVSFAETGAFAAAYPMIGETPMTGLDADSPIVSPLR